MPRLTEAERQKLMGDFNGHYDELLETHPGWEITPGFGLPQLRALEATYNAKQAQIVALEATGMPAKRAQRDALFGLDNEDLDGVWFYLLLYKGNVKLKLGPKAALSKTAPNIGKIGPGSLDHVLESYINHWTLVNKELADKTPPQPALVIGPITLAELTSRRAQIAALTGQIDESVITRLAVMRVQREEIMGDVREDDRAEDSVVARVSAYSIEVRSQFAGTALAQTVPRIFPKEASETLPRFAFNFRASGAQVTLWWQMPDDVEDAAVIYLKEGAFEETRAIPATGTLQVVFDGVATQDEIDEVELRDGDGKTVAHGRFDGDAHRADVSGTERMKSARCHLVSRAFRLSLFF